MMRLALYGAAAAVALYFVTKWRKGQTSPEMAEQVRVQTLVAAKTAAKADAKSQARAMRMAAAAKAGSR